MKITHRKKIITLENKLLHAECHNFHNKLLPLLSSSVSRGNIRLDKFKTIGAYSIVSIVWIDTLIKITISESKTVVRVIGTPSSEYTLELLKCM